jgi:hypothetical protein
MARILLEKGGTPSIEAAPTGATAIRLAVAFGSEELIKASP